MTVSYTRASGDVTHGEDCRGQKVQDGMKAQYIVEQILFRRALEHRLEGYTLDTAIEICEALKPGSGHEEDGFWLVYRP